MKLLEQLHLVKVFTLIEQLNSHFDNSFATSHSVGNVTVKSKPNKAFLYFLSAMDLAISFHQWLLRAQKNQKIISTYPKPCRIQQIGTKKNSGRFL